jgi:hypothetical protein
MSEIEIHHDRDYGAARPLVPFLIPRRVATPNARTR